MIAQTINRMMGGTLVGPWDIDQLDNAAIDAIMEIAHGLPAIRQAARQIEDAKASIRSRNPSMKRR